MKNTKNTESKVASFEKPKTRKKRKSAINIYLTNLIEEKGREIDGEIQIEGHIGLTWADLIKFIDTTPEYHEQIRMTLVKIDLYNGDVFHFLNHLAVGMVKSLGY